MTKQDVLPITHLAEKIRATHGIDAARVYHTKKVKEQFARAKKGEVINLTDLLASRENLSNRKY